jgi:hypothetical protein
MQARSLRASVALGVLSLPLWLSGCQRSGHVASVHTFRPDPPPGRALATGRDCSFHFLGMRARDLSVRDAARHALEGHAGTELSDMTVRTVLNAPFEVCVEVEGIVRSDGELAASGSEVVLSL